jgi:hypothetical protein
VSSGPHNASALLQRALFGLASAFWVITGGLVLAGLLNVGGSESASLVIGVLMLGNGVLLGLSAWATLRGRHWVDRGALLLVVANAVLSVTDEMGVWDWLSLAISALLVGLVVGNGYAEHRARRVDP